MTRIPLDESISFDHTFKVASNIGYLREDGKWICEYDGLFIVLNKDGKVLSWQLTKGTSFAHIQDLLQDIIQRHHQDHCIKTVYVDDCCKIRSKIKSVLGAHVIVKLDLFHAVQRITKTISKRHPLMQLCMRDLRCIFRSDGDSGEKRLDDTPPPDVILSKLDTFTTKWKDRADDKGVILFKSETFKAFTNIKRHISAGCLSGIPPGGGTNRNERLHKHINSFFNRSRIGILLAYALLTTIFHSHNNSKKFAGKVFVQPVMSTSLMQLTNIKPIGITPKQRVMQQDLQKSDHWEMDQSDRIDNVEYMSSIVAPIYF